MLLSNYNKSNKNGKERGKWYHLLVIFFTQIKELPPLKLIKKPVERVDQMIKEMKESTTIREVTLSMYISDTNPVS